MAWIDDILDNFFTKELFKRYDYYVEGTDSIGTAILTLVNYIENDYLKYADLSALKKYYLHDLPKDEVIFPDEALAVHDALLDFYQLLHQKSHIKTKDYKNVLAFFQNNKSSFLKKMEDESFWSPAKKSEIDQFDQELLDSIPPEFDQLFKKLSGLNETAPTKNTANKNNIINFPGTPGKLDDAAGYALQLRIDLAGFKPPIWRRVLISSEATLADLHQVIQACFEWEDEHLHDFEVNGFFYEPAEAAVIEEFSDSENGNEDDITLGEAFAVAKMINYTYDFGDDWQHKIKCEKRLDLADLETQELPLCIKGRQKAPLENSRFEESYGADFNLTEINQRLAQLDF